MATHHNCGTNRGNVSAISYCSSDAVPESDPAGRVGGDGGIELLISLTLILPAFYRPLAFLIPIVTACIAVEMLLFVGLHLCAGEINVGLVIYWVVVAAICAFIAYGRWVIRPL